MRPQIESEFFEPPRPRVIAHRGASGQFPENTMVAFRAAVETGAPYIELDVHMTRDGEVVVIHDPDLKRTAECEERVREMSYAELAAADAGFRFSPDGVTFPFRGGGLSVPRLAEVFAACPRTHFIVEVKQSEPSLAASLLSVIDGARMRRRVVVASEHQRPLDEFRRLAPSIPTAMSAAEAARFFEALGSGETGYIAPGDVLAIPPEYDSIRLVSAESVGFAHRMGLEVHVWTVNEEAAMRELLALGVDGIITDFPARLLALTGS